MTLPVGILALATASPPFALSQSDARQVARDLFSERFPQFERLAPVFTTAGVRTRQIVRPIEWYLHPRGWPERGEAYLEGAVDLFVDAATKARGEAGLAGSDIDILVVLKGPVRPSQEISRTGGIVSEVCLEYDAVIQCLFMEEERFREAGSPLLRNIYREAIEL